MAKVVCIVPRMEMLEPAKCEAAKQGLGDFTVYRAETSQIYEIADKAIHDGAEIFVARGLHAAMLKQYCNIPLVEFRLTGQEMGLLVKKAKEIAEKECPVIAIIGNHNMFCDMSCFGELFGVHLREYFVQDKTELSRAADTAARDGVDVVIGGEVVCSRSRQNGVPAIFLESGEESFAEAMRMVQSVAFAVDLEKSKAVEIQALLDYSHNGIIMIDQTGCITRMNHLAEKLLQMDEKKWKQPDIKKLVPQIDEAVLQRAMHGEETHSLLLTVYDTSVIAHVAPMQADGAVKSVIISFYEQLHVEEMEEEIRREQYDKKVVAQFTFDRLAYKSESSEHIVEKAKQYANFRAPVLMIGEHGTEKEMLAQCIYNASMMKYGKFLSVNCDGIQPQELDMILFGIQEDGREIKRGLADMAEGGILFINEIQKMDMYAQYKLYKVVQKQTVLRSGNSRPLPVRVRILAASHCNLEPLVRQGLFREDLYYALNVLNLYIPPLRERKEDVMAWIDRYMEEAGAQYSRYFRITSGARRRLMEFEWAGNLPQIRGFCERIDIMAPKRMVDEKFIAEQLSLAYPVIRRNKENQIVVYKDPKALELAEILEECGGSRTLAAQRLGVSKSTLWRYIKKYSLE